MMKYSTVLLALLFVTFTASAQSLDEADIELKQQEMEQQALQVSDWFQDQGYLRSNLMLAVTVLSQQKRPPVDRVLEILNASINPVNSGQLQKSDWHRLVRFCQKAPLKKKFVRAESDRAENANLLVNWCEENDILKQFIQKDAGNAYAYLFQIDYSADNLYTRANQRMLLKAAAAEYVTDYFGYGLQTYTTHLREYYRTHQVKSIIPPAGFVLADKPEDMFVLYYSTYAIAVYVAFQNRVLGYCNISPRQLQPGYDEKTVLACLRLMGLFRSDNNTVSDNVVANAVIASLSPPGSDEQLEANRQKITNRLTFQCLSTWGDRESKDSYAMEELAVFLKMIPLFESMGEIQAMAAASDQYFAERQNKDAPKPSSCLLLKDLSLENAEKLSAEKK